MALNGPEAAVARCTVKPRSSSEAWLHVRSALAEEVAVAARPTGLAGAAGSRGSSTDASGRSTVPASGRSTVPASGRSTAPASAPPGRSLWSSSPPGQPATASSETATSVQRVQGRRRGRACSVGVVTAPVNCSRRASQLLRQVAGFTACTAPPRLAARAAHPRRYSGRRRLSRVDAFTTARRSPANALLLAETLLKSPGTAAGTSVGAIPRARAARREQHPLEVSAGIITLRRLLVPALQLHDDAHLARD